MTAHPLHKAILWEALPKLKVQCRTCSHYCVINDEHHGICGVRYNEKGELYSRVYEHPVAAHLDPIEKKPLFHFYPGSKAFSLGTFGCNFHCDFCQNFDISQHKNLPISGNRLTAKQVLIEALHLGAQSIAYTYNEPAIFLEYVLDIATQAKKHGLKNVYISNGFESPETLNLLNGKIDAMNIDLKAFTEKFYKNHCGAQLKPVLENIVQIYEKNIWMEITTLLIPGLNDSEKEIREMARFIAKLNPEIPWHLSRYFPAYKLKTQATPVSRMKEARALAVDEGLQYVYLGNVPGEENTTRCPHCNTEVITRRGYRDIVKKSMNGFCSNCGNEIKGVF